MKIFSKLAKEVLDSGKAIGFKTNVSNATGWLKSHSKGVGEQIGNALSGNAKSINGWPIFCMRAHFKNQTIHEQEWHIDHKEEPTYIF